jgi:O-acetyl-ADP-ribose deacetylase (regulator of RNase III)
VAFPAISTKIFGYPPDAAAQVAVTAVRDFLAGDDHGIHEVILVAFNAEDLARFERLLGDND